MDLTDTFLKFLPLRVLFFFKFKEIYKQTQAYEIFSLSCAMSWNDLIYDV